MINRVYIPAKLAVKIDGTRYFKVEEDVMQRLLQEVMGREPEVEVEISITKVGNKKTNPQLRYFYGVILPIIKVGLEELQGENYTKAEVMMFLKDKFFYEEVELNGDFLRLPMTLSKATKQEVSKFINDVINFGNEMLNLHIPPCL
jgi:hypothetical protein